MYTTINGMTFISGDYGKYNGKVKDYSVCYGRNSANNARQYVLSFREPLPDIECSYIDYKPRGKKGGIIRKISDFIQNIKFNRQMKKCEKQLKKMDVALSKMPALNFVQKYMPGNPEITGVDKMALMGAAYEELGSREVSLKSLNSRLSSIDAPYAKEISADALDLNNDGKIDVAEYSTSILLEDALSTDSSTVRAENIDGIITRNGSDASFAYSVKGNKEAAKETFTYLYDTFDLGQAKKEFLSHRNNLV